MAEELTLGLAQIAPVWLQREATLDKVCTYVRKAAEQGCQLVVFGECLVPGYPFWLEHTGGARFNDDFQKSMHAHYLEQAVCIERGDLAPLCQIAAETKTTVMIGCYERASDRGGHSGYCSLVTIDRKGDVANVHRKAMPTYEERLVWGIGDGHGLRVFEANGFTIGGLNCWENWMPLMRAALYGQGEDLHIAVWPGSERNTIDISRFVAVESRSFVASVSGLMRREDIPSDIPHAEHLRKACPEVMADGGSCLAAPDGQWVLAPMHAEEQLSVATIRHELVRRERQNFDPAGHYSRPDITELRVNRTRQRTIRLVEDGTPGNTGNCD